LYPFCLWQPLLPKPLAPGAGDEAQACLSKLGYEVTTLTYDKLVSESLSQYDAIIT
jgi:hypothetical protein